MFGFGCAVYVLVISSCSGGIVRQILPPPQLECSASTPPAALQPPAAELFLSPLNVVNASDESLLCLKIRKSVYLFPLEECPVVRSLRFSARACLRDLDVLLYWFPRNYSGKEIG